MTASVKTQQLAKLSALALLSVLGLTSLNVAQSFHPISKDHGWFIATQTTWPLTRPVALATRPTTSTTEPSVGVGPVRTSFINDRLLLAPYAVWWDFRFPRQWSAKAQARLGFTSPACFLVDAATGQPSAMIPPEISPILITPDASEMVAIKAIRWNRPGTSPTTRPATKLQRTSVDGKKLIWERDFAQDWFSQAAVSADGKVIALRPSSLTPTYVLVIDALDGHTMATAPCGPSDLSTLDATGQELVVARASNEESIKAQGDLISVYDTKSGKRKAMFGSATHTAADVWVRDGRVFVAVGRAVRSLDVYDLKKQTLVTTLNIPPMRNVWAVAPSPDGTYAAVLREGGNVDLIDLATKKAISLPTVKAADADAALGILGVTAETSAEVFSATFDFSPDGSSLALARAILPQVQAWKLAPYLTKLREQK